MRIAVIHFGLALGLAISLSVSAADGRTSGAEPRLHRGDEVRVALFSGAIYHLRLNSADDENLVGRSGALSVHLRHAEIASVRREPAPRAAASMASAGASVNASAAALGLLGLSAVSQGAVGSFGAGHACNGTGSGC